ncbi:TPA: hypothetical protein HA239_05285 [Candidatus Woesearchaeota archaeon]|nr:hypothetical protein QT06_C0001G0283 [archaeon GW2011_AR15]MBS3103604.1 hypothetical protein [Candidatus Woesearchaeota archaeon]HIH41796.1 hypothetical protein [Candidatus Woesearchaeota archaeon]
MLTLNHILLLLVTYSGLLVGTIISHFTKEELKAGKKYFIFARPVVLSLVFFYFLKFLAVSPAISIPLSGIIAVLYFLWDVKSNLPYNDVLAYSLLAVILFETAGTFAAGLIFIFGLLTASVYYDTKENLAYNLILPVRDNIVYLFIGIVIALI